MQKNFTRGEKKSLKALKDDGFKKQARHENGLIDYNKFMELIKSKENEMNHELVSKHFFVPTLGILFGQIKDLKNNPEKNKKLASIIKSGLKDIKQEIKEMSKEEREIEKPNEIVEIAQKILKFNEQQQEGKRLKILTPNQMLSRLPICLAQLRAGNNSQKLKNEIRQLLYFLFQKI